MAKNIAISKWFYLVGVLGLVLFNVAYLYSSSLYALFSAAYESAVKTDGRGFVSRVFTDIDHEEYNYALFVPFEIDVTQKTPLIVSLHGLGKRGKEGVNQVIDGIGPSVWEMKRDFPYLVFFPQARKDTDWSTHPDLVMRTMRQLDSVIQEYNVDTNRIYMTGISSGGEGVWTFAEHYPDRFAALVSVSAPKASLDGEKTVLQHQIPVWSVYVRGDIEKLVEFNREQHKRLLSAGISPHYTELAGDRPEISGTHDGWNFTFRYPPIYEWLSTHSLDRKDSSEANFTNLFLEESDLSKHWQDPDSAWMVEEGDQLVYQPDASNTPSHLITRDSFSDYQLHLEFRIAQESLCSIQFGESENRLELILGSPLSNKTGLCDLQRHEYLDRPELIGSHGIFANEWNDLRIEKQGRLLNVRLNGWLLHQYESDKIESLSGPLSLAVPESTFVNEPEKVTWRYIRIRESK